MPAGRHRPDLRGGGRPRRGPLHRWEAFGGGTIAYDEAERRILPHIHVSVGFKEHSATAHTSHLLSAKVQFLTEIFLVELSRPGLRRERDPDLYDVPLLRFRSTEA